MLTDYQILLHLGMEIQDQYLHFFDDDENEFTINFEDIEEIIFESSYTPFHVKASYWLHYFFVDINIGGVPFKKSYLEDYRKVFELNICLKSNQVLSRTVRDINPYEVQNLIDKLNQFIQKMRLSQK